VTQSHPQIIDSCGGATAVAEKMRVKPARVRMWIFRRRIPRSAWPEVIEAYPNLSVEALKAAEVL
jgi:hypothetical protein